MLQALKNGSMWRGIFEDAGHAAGMLRSGISSWSKGKGFRGGMMNYALGQARREVAMPAGFGRGARSEVSLDVVRPRSNSKAVQAPHQLMSREQYKNVQASGLPYSFHGSVKQDGQKMFKVNPSPKINVTRGVTHGGDRDALLHQARGAYAEKMMGNFGSGLGALGMMAGGGLLVSGMMGGPGLFDAGMVGAGIGAIAGGKAGYKYLRSQGVSRMQMGKYALGAAAGIGALAAGGSGMSDLGVNPAVGFAGLAAAGMYAAGGRGRMGKIGRFAAAPFVGATRLGRFVGDLKETNRLGAFALGAGTVATVAGGLNWMKSGDATGGFGGKVSAMMSGQQQQYQSRPYQVGHPYGYSGTMR